MFMIFGRPLLSLESIARMFGVLLYGHFFLCLLPLYIITKITLDLRVSWSRIDEKQENVDAQEKLG